MTDKDPEPLKHVDAERVGSESGGAGGSGDPDAEGRAQEIENDDAANPEDETLRDIKGG